jgi:Transglycosylase-like domain
MIMVRRVLILAFISVSGIALLSPLSARSAAQLPDAPPDHLLALQPAPADDVARGGVLTGRGSTVRTEAATGSDAEALVSRPDDVPASVTMEATLVFIAPPAPPAASAPAAPVATYSGNSVWDDLAHCESSGNWAINTGNGYYGGLQFSLGTWNGYGGAEFAEYPHQATRAEQITVAERLRDARGYQPWPACRAKLGLP